MTVNAASRTNGRTMRRRFGLVALSVLVISCVQADRPESPGQTALAPVAASAAASTSAAAQPALPPAGGAAPTSAGSVPTAGVLFVIGADDGIYRYDGSSGRISSVWRASTFGRAGRRRRLRVGPPRRSHATAVDGTTASVACSQGYASQMSSRGGCVFSGTDGIFVQLSGEATPRLVLPADWGGGSPVWSPDGRRLLVERLIAPRPDLGWIQAWWPCGCSSPTDERVSSTGRRIGECCSLLSGRPTDDSRSSGSTRRRATPWRRTAWAPRCT